MDLRTFVRLALDEDIGPGDLTTESCVPVARQGHGVIVAKQDVVMSGHTAAAETFRQTGAHYGVDVSYEAVVADGARANVGQVVARIEGSMAALLTGERVALNLLMKLSGIASHVGEYVRAADGKLRVVCTRKTTPLLRALEKQAVRHGGAHNHRFALYDGVMIKDNHIAAVGDIGRAVAAARERVHHLVRIEVEVSDMQELAQALKSRADVVLLDNMDDAQLAQAVQVARAASYPVLLEASGNMSPERIEGIRDLGLDVVSAGGLIHQAVWVDLSMRIQA
ncbi:MAG: nicotinate-nucleotide pyrophosphorylase (carboxylating) [Kiritimatiellia bacterium]|jgi:nicotinate-nucleotide pyrophosphorylase (carboxylating)